MITISVDGKPDSISQNALKFSNSNSSCTSNSKTYSVTVVTVIFMAPLFRRHSTTERKKINKLKYESISTENQQKKSFVVVVSFVAIRCYFCNNLRLAGYECGCARK